MENVINRGKEIMDIVLGNSQSKIISNKTAKGMSESPEVSSAKEISNKYRNLFKVIKDTESKLEKLNGAKDDLTAERFSELHTEYSDFLEKGTCLLDDTLKIMDSKLEGWLTEITAIEEKQNSVKSQIAQEEKLHQIGAISELAYETKISPLLLEEKECGELYQSKAILIKILNDAKKDPTSPCDTANDNSASGRTAEKPDRADRTDGTDSNPSHGGTPPVHYKNPSVAVVLSFFWAGLGQIYNGQISKGVIFIVIYIFSCLLIFLGVGLISTPILWIWGMYDAYNSAMQINKELAVNRSW